MVRVLYLLSEIMFIVYITYEYHSWIVKRALCLRALGTVALSFWKAMPSTSLKIQEFMFPLPPPLFSLKEAPKPYCQAVSLYHELDTQRGTT